MKMVKTIKRKISEEGSDGTDDRAEEDEG